MLSLSYRELGERLSVNPEAARAVARRRRWKRVIGNDGLARIFVPPDDLDDVRGGRPRGRPSGTTHGRARGR